MKYFLFFTIVAIALAHPPRLVEVAKEVNAMKTTWIANEAIPTRDYTQYLGVLFGDRQLPSKTIVARGDLPESFDPVEKWPECPSLKEIRDQSVCGSCWAFGAAEAATDRLCIASKGKIQDRLSEQDLLTCCDSCGFGCDGGWLDMAWRWFQSTGVTTGGEYGSKDWCNAYSFPKCEHHAEGKYPPCGESQETPECVKQCQEGYPVEYEKDKHFFGEAYYVQGGIDAIKTELMTNGPLEVSFFVYEDFLTYKSGIYKHVAGKYLGGHAVKLVGWGVEDGVEYWKIANSWNEDWGENGYFRIVAGKDECGIEVGPIGGIPKL